MIHQPPGGLPRKGTQLGSGAALHHPVLGACHGAADDLAGDQLHALVGEEQQVVDRLALAGFHRIPIGAIACGYRPQSRPDMTLDSPEGQCQSRGLRGARHQGRSSLFNTDRIHHSCQDAHDPDQRFVLHPGDLINSSSLVRIVPQVKPDEIYSLAVQSDVAVSFEELEYTANSDALGTLRLLEAIRILGLEKKTRFYRASTSEVLGKVQEIPQRETTPLLRGRIPRARAPRVTLTAAGACRGSTDLFIAERDILPSPELQ
jgi:hypothetical protein